MAGMPYVVCVCCGVRVCVCLCCLTTVLCCVLCCVAVAIVCGVLCVVLCVKRVVRCVLLLLVVACCCCLLFVVVFSLHFHTDFIIRHSLAYSFLSSVPHCPTVRLLCLSGAPVLRAIFLASTAPSPRVTLHRHR